MNELKCLEHPTLKVPYEVFNKKYRNAQKILDMEARHVSNATSEIENTVEKEAKAGEIDNLLGGMVERLTALKRKASEAINEELHMAFVCKKRLDHLKEHAHNLTQPATPQVKAALSSWRKIRLDRMLVDYSLRNGYYNTAKQLAEAVDIKELTNVEIYSAAAEVESELSERRTQRCLVWCADNKTKLRKIGSTMEFNIRIQEFIELFRQDKRLEAVKYAKKYLSSYEEGQLPEIQLCMGMLAFPKDTDVERYKSAISPMRWRSLESQFRVEHGRLLHPAPLPALPALLQLGLSALNTPQCVSPSTHVAGCPCCAPPLSALARTLPLAPCAHSRLTCRISHTPLNEHNHPMVLPNGQVYGEKALKEMMKEQGTIICPKTKEVFCIKRVEKVYVM